LFSILGSAKAFKEFQEGQNSLMEFLIMAGIIVGIIIFIVLYQKIKK